MLSRLLRFSVVDGTGRRGRQLDFAVDLSPADYPIITQIYYRGPDAVQRVAPWSAVQNIDWPRRQINLANLAEGIPTSPDLLEKVVLLGRDVLDALVLDLQEGRATRANDLDLGESDGKLWLRAADTSPWGVIRRLSFGVLGHIARRDLYDWKYVEFLRGDPHAAHKGRDYHRRIAHLPPGEIARLSDALPYLHAAELITLLPDPVAADTLEALVPERQVQVLEELDREQVRRLLLLMRPDVVADLLGQLDPQEARSWLETMAASQRERVLKLLRYPEDSAGGIMTNDLITMPGEITTAAALQILRSRLSKPDFINFFHEIYIVDDENTQRLRGTLPLRDLIVAGDDATLDTIMNPYSMTLYPLQKAIDAARRVIDSELPALPVVARDGQLLGAVTVDAALALVAPGSWRTQTPRLFS